MPRNIQIPAIVALIFFLGACSSFMNTPALPSSSLSITEELKYIHETDQVDRRQNIARYIFVPAKRHYKNKKLLTLYRRDSARVSRVYDIYSENNNLKPMDQYHIAYTFFHGSGGLTTLNSMYFRLAYQVFDELSKQSEDKVVAKSGKYYKPIALERWQEELNYYK